MSNCLESLTIFISPSFAKKTKLQYGSLVTIKSDKEVSYPALVYVKKKLKVDKIINENGCIPDCLNKEAFDLVPGYPWLFAAAITFSCDKIYEQNSIFNLQTEMKMDPNKITEPFSLSNLSSSSNFCQLLKQELIENSSLCLKLGMKIRFVYLTQTFILTVKNILSNFYEFSEDMTNNKVAFSCFNDTHIDIIDNETDQNAEDHLNFEKFGGYTSQIEDLNLNISQFLEEGKKNVSGILISGMSGVGKTYIGTILQALYKDKFRYLSSEDIISLYKNEAEVILKNEFSKAYAKGTSIIFIDNIDEICSSRDHDAQTAGIVNALLYLMDGIHTERSQGMLVIATATQPDLLDQALRRPGRLAHDIILPVPNEQDRLGILHCLLQGTSLLSSELLAVIASKTSGFVAADLLNLVTEIFALAENHTTPSVDHLEDALATVKPSSLKRIALKSRQVLLEDVIGNQALLSSLILTFELNLKHRELFLDADIVCPSRILIFGPPGCGKTMAILGLAARFNLAIIPVRRSNVFGKFFGESEKNLGQLFHQAQKCSPCILHFENFDGLAGRRHKNAEVSSDVEERIINHLKVMLDGVVGYENIFVVAETNRPDLLDKDVIRRGRFHKYFYFDLPSDDERRTVLERGFEGAPVLGSSIQSQTEHVEDLVSRTNGYSVAEIILLCKEIRASQEGENDLLDQEENAPWRSLTALEEAFESVSPRTSSKMMKQYQRFASLFCPELEIN